MMWGKHKENGIWISTYKNDFRFLLGNGRKIYIAFFKFRMRIV